MRSLEHALDYFLYEHEGGERCKCDLRSILVFSCTSPWCREQALRRRAYSLGDTRFTLTSLSDAEAVDEVGRDGWLAVQRAADTTAKTTAARVATETREMAPVGTAQTRRMGTARWASRNAEQLTIMLYDDPKHEYAVSDGSAKTTANTADTSSTRISAVAPPPALSDIIGWWQPNGWAVHIEGFRADLPAVAGLVTMVQQGWTGTSDGSRAPCRVTGLSIRGWTGSHAADPHAAILSLLESAAPTLRQLEVHLLEQVPPPRPVSSRGAAASMRLRHLELSSCAVDLHKVADWLGDSPLATLCISGDAPFRSMPAPTRRQTSSRDSSTGTNGRPSLMESELARLTPASLRSLVLDETNVTPVHLRPISCRRSLQRLSLTGCTEVDEVDLTDMRALRTLLLARCPIVSLDALRHLEHCQCLVLLNVCGCTQINDLNALAALPNLRQLFAYQTSITNDGIRRLCECTEMEKINFGGCGRLSDATPLGQMRRLRELHLWSTGITNNGIAALRGCTALAELVLDDCHRLTDVSALGELPSLRWLSLIGTSVTLEGITALAGCPSLEALAIAGTEVANAPRLWSHDAVVKFLERVVVE